MERQELERELERLHPECFGWAMACSRRDRQEAEDTLQTSYLKALEGRARFAGRSSLKVWFFGVIRRTASERRRRDFFRLRRLAAQTPPAEAPDGAPDPEESAELSERRARLLSALGRLPRRQGEVLSLVYYHDLTIEEAASVLGLSLGTARVHHERGKKRLRQELGAGGKS
jgi:RNA polymerase sigma-70 factor (ECF subfamily)